ncbi:MAG: DUF3805 domain-containing protein [Bacteroidaceae bacterium]
MATKGKRFISPGAWFALTYPADWFESEDAEGSFLFYNPERWEGNFRVSAFRKDRRERGADRYAREEMARELTRNPQAVSTRVGTWECVYEVETFEEGGAWYATHLWLTGEGDLCVECSLTVPRGTGAAVGEGIVASLELRPRLEAGRPACIPVRVAEIAEINLAFDWAARAVKAGLKRDFTGSAADVASLQQLVDRGLASLADAGVRSRMGMVLGVIAEAEADGLEWRTCVERGDEYAALQHGERGPVVRPDRLLRPDDASLQQTFDRLLARLCGPQA